jgi:predicted  nucleic acid-binding Zn-ribbon protein
MDPEDRMTAEELRVIRGSGWAAIILAVLGFAAAAGFGGLYFINYSESKLATEKVDDIQSEQAAKTGELKETITRLTGELEGKRDKIEALEAKLKKEEMAKLEEKTRADSLTKTVSDQKERIEDLKSGNREVVRLQGELAGKDAQVHALENQLLTARSDLSNTRSNLSSAKTENEKLEKQVNRLRMELNSKTVGKATADVLQEQLKDKERLVEEFREKLRKSEEALQKRNQEVATLRETLGKAGKEAEELQKAKDELSKRDREIGRKDSQIQGLNTKIEKLEEQAQIDRRQIDSLRNTLAQRGDISDQVKSLSDALAGRDETIKKKDEEIAALKEAAGKLKESTQQTTETSGARTKELEKQLGEKSAEVDSLLKGMEELQEERNDLYTRLKAEKRAVELIEKGEEFEQIKLIPGFWRTTNTMTLTVSDDILPGHKIDLDNDLDLEMAKGILFFETVASARFGFLLDYQELSFAGRTVMSSDKNFYGKTFNAGNTVDSEFYVQQVGLGLMANLGALHKSDTRRIDLNALLGGRYMKINARMLDRGDGDRASDSFDAPVLFPGLRVSARYRDGISWSVQGRAMSYQFGDFDLRNFVEARVSFGLKIMKSLDIEFGYIYSDLHYRRDDKDTGENFHTKIKSEGPYLSLIWTF